jgi:DNA repair protein RadA/Sms
VGIDEVDRVLGGGMVPGAVVLLAGEPGVGKSTLLLQVAGSIARSGGRTLIAGAEESAEQVGLRARRLGVSGDRIVVASDRDVDAVIAAADALRPDLLVIDSVQTIAAADAGGAPGGVAQVSESAARIGRFAKDRAIPVVLIGHVTKTGAIAGPKVLEHAVDVVLALEGDPERGLRMLRCLKNRFGPTQQVGFFEMGDSGLVEVQDPGDLLIARGRGPVAGSVIFPAVDGRRPLLVEVQALVVATPAPQPRRSVKGVEVARVHQVLAVLDRHAGLPFVHHDVYVSVVGGIRVRDPGADLPVAIALASSLLGRRLGPVAAWGEVGLTGEVRRVGHGEHRAAEAKRLGIGVIVGPAGNGEDHIAQALERAGMAA